MFEYIQPDDDTGHGYVKFVLIFEIGTWVDLNEARSLTIDYIFSNLWGEGEKIMCICCLNVSYDGASYKIRRKEKGVDFESHISSHYPPWLVRDLSTSKKRKGWGQGVEKGERHDKVVCTLSHCTGREKRGVEVVWGVYEEGNGIGMERNYYSVVVYVEMMKLREGVIESRSTDE